jgi:hypothetical protein
MQIPNLNMTIYMFLQQLYDLAKKWLLVQEGTI